MQSGHAAPLCADDGYRGHTQSASGIGWSSFRPNAHGGAVAQGKSLQPRGHNLQVCFAAPDPPARALGASLTAICLLHCHDAGLDDVTGALTPARKRSAWKGG